MNTEQATIEQNEIIAQFMGWQKVERDGAVAFVQDGYRRYDYEFHYNDSWAHLIPVVEKIATLCPNDVVHMEFGKTYTRCNLWNLDNGRTHVFDESKDTPILTVYQAVYQFIQWYNKKKQ